MEAFGYNDFLPYNGYVHKVERKDCIEGTIDPKVCDALTNAVIDDTSKLNQVKFYHKNMKD